MICGICGNEHTGIITSDGICDDCRFGRKPKAESKPKAVPKKKKAKPKVETTSEVKE